MANRTLSEYKQLCRWSPGPRGTDGCTWVMGDDVHLPSFRRMTDMQQISWIPTNMSCCFTVQAAGASGSLRCVSAVNKYGQSVMHIAARNGSGPLLSLLLAAGGGALVGRRDDKGDTPVDVARKNRHVAALEAFRRVVPVGGQGGGGRRQQVEAWAAA